MRKVHVAVSVIDFNLKDLLPVVLLKCDLCPHWVHLRVCCETRVIRRGDVFKCPHCLHKNYTPKEMNITVYICKYFSFHDVFQFKVRTELQIVTTFRYTNFLLTGHVLAIVHWFFAINARSHVSLSNIAAIWLGWSRCCCQKEIDWNFFIVRQNDGIHLKVRRIVIVLESMLVNYLVPVFKRKKREYPCHQDTQYYSFCFLESFLGPLFNFRKLLI